MPTGPFNFPRLTDLGPFSDIEAEQEFKRRTNQQQSETAFLDREISSIHNIDTDAVTRVDSKLIVREKLVDDVDGIMDVITREIDVITRDEEIAIMRYWIKDDIGRIISVFVEDDFRNMGIATTLKNKELKFMEDSGVEIVYTDVVSNGGYRLAVKTGFKPITQADHLIGTEATLTFNPSLNTGIMYKYI